MRFLHERIETIHFAEHEYNHIQEMFTLTVDKTNVQGQR